jgi:response regulator of citrate/malate metabolism
MIKFILIDDDEMINFIHRQVILSVEPSAEVNIILSAEEGVDTLNKLSKSNNPNRTIVFVDINMPEINGFELLGQLNPTIANQQNLQLYMVSSSLFQSDREKSMVFPFVKGYREKPLRKEIIKEILEKAG